MINNLKYEDNISEIDRIISINISKWRLSGAIPSISKEDIEQELRQKIFIKWDLYDPTKGPLQRWLTVVINNEIKNLIRNHYYKYANACVSCPANLGGGQCKLYGNTENSNCNVYKKWVIEKKQKHDVNLPVALDNHIQEVSEKPWEETDLIDKINELKFKLQEKLTNNEFYIFNALYLDNKNEQDIINELKFSSRAAGIRAIKQLKDMIIPLVKDILINDGLI
jgi:hypothetical protein